eukprot:TRINITY_DN1383_c0_g1_i7.p1 TRINITY_DN1383_c0_g1~~TRINITY_DN1383_c0_g1_i7.p1  ORF type:complete len:201 (+),score=57.90 TRINITY_DN1383_c0_g1_i7:130-732(+)
MCIRDRALAEATPSSGNDPQSSCGSCVSAGSYEFGVACGDTEYTVKVGDVKVTSSGILPSVSDMSTSIAEWLKIPAKRVECAGWSIGSNNITCSVKDERAVHSASYMLRMMHLEASKGNLMIAGAQVGSFKFTWQSESMESEEDEVYMLASVGILLVILGPFMFYKQFIDETYEITTSREKKRRQMMIDRDRKARARSTF